MGPSVRLDFVAAGLFSSLLGAGALAQELGSRPPAASRVSDSPDNHSPVWPALIAYDPPVARAVDRQVTVTMGRELNFALDATDPDGDGITYAALKIPQQASFDIRSGAFSWTTSEHDKGMHLLRFSATDGAKTTVLDLQVRVVPNQPPDTRVTDEMGTQFFVGDHVRYRLAEDHDGDPLRLRVTALPPGATLDTAGAELWFDWTPSAGDVGKRELAFVVSDGEANVTIHKTLSVHPDWDKKTERAYFAPSAGYALNAPFDGPVLMGPSFELTIAAIRRGGYEAYACDGRSSADCTPSHHRFYFAFETLLPVGRSQSSSGDGEALFTYAFGLTRSFEFQPSRRWLVPHYGLEAGAMTGSGGTVAEVVPFLGMHLWTDRHIWLNLTAGARVVPGDDLSSRSGGRANLSLMVHAW